VNHLGVTIYCSLIVACPPDMGLIATLTGPGAQRYQATFKHLELIGAEG
jgi:hypothetical protein